MIFLPWFGELTCQHESAGLRRFSSDEVLRLSREIHPLRFPRLEGGPFFHQPPVPWIEPLALFGPANTSSSGAKTSFPRLRPLLQKPRKKVWHHYDNST